MEITKIDFEKFVPAFTDATEEVYNKVKSAIDQQLLETTMLFGTGYESRLADVQIAKKAVSMGAAYRVFTQMDLVLTPTGFGIVRNDHLTPASRERTDALREDLRQQHSMLLDMILDQLLHTEWRDSTEAARLTDGLLYSPTMLRRYGVKTPQGGRIFHEEMQSLASALAESAAKVELAISPELYADLVAKQRNEAGMEPEEIIVLEAARKYQAALLTTGYPRAAVELHKRLERLLEQYSTNLTAYVESSTYAANHAERYENKQEDPTFFFC